MQNTPEMGVFCLVNNLMAGASGYISGLDSQLHTVKAIISVTPRACCDTLNVRIRRLAHNFFEIVIEMRLRAII